jgi:hypothetical protein
MALHMDTPMSLSPDTEPNEGDTKLDPLVLLRALRALRKGQFSTRIATGNMHVCITVFVISSCLFVSVIFFSGVGDFVLLYIT